METSQNDTALALSLAPLYLQAVLLPVFAWPAWLLCVPPIVWHFRQGNIAAGSATFWITINNFYNAINPLIWPRDNITEWSTGSVWCDIGVRFQVGTIAGLTASTVMIVRKLAKVMDTRSITVSTSRQTRKKEVIWEMVWCWVYPLLLIILYYIVQPIRYLIYGIVGCIAAFHASLPSIIFNSLGTLTIFVAACYSSKFSLQRQSPISSNDVTVLLTYRLYRYRREFARLVAARNTTRSRFIRLFILSLIIVIGYTPYSVWLLLDTVRELRYSYSWDEVHGPEFNTVMKIPTYGQVPTAKWVQVATGYVFFLIFGTGKDAYNMYRKMLLAIGFGRFFPSLHNMAHSGSGTPSSFISARTWGSRVSSHARSVFTFSKNDSPLNTYDDTARNNSEVYPLSSSLHTVTTQDYSLTRSNTKTKNTSAPKASYVKRLFQTTADTGDILPLYSRNGETVHPEPYSSATLPSSSARHSQAWVTELPAPERAEEMVGVPVVHEVRLDSHENAAGKKEEK